ncbi:MAG: DUF3168 domain-containing protein [Anaerolineae bacterium]|nr:DUF3168 domain-containing protein [Anaerolineae bacterium]
MTSVLTAERWVVGLLREDATMQSLVAGRIYSGVVPQSAVYPFVLVQRVSSRTVMGVGTAVIMWDELVMVKGVDKAESYSTLETIMNRVRGVLHGASGDVTNGIVIGCVEERTIMYPEVVDGVQYRHLGIEFRVWTQ